MRILLLNTRNECSLGDSYRRAFETLGHDVVHPDSISRLHHSLVWRIRLIRRVFERPILRQFNAELLDAFGDSSFDLCWVGKGDWALPAFWQRYRRRQRSTKLVCYNPDNPITAFSRGGNRPWVTEAISFFDLYCTYNAHLVQPLGEAGARAVLHLPFAWDPDLHPGHHDVPGSGGDCKLDIVFIGNWDRSRESWLTPIALAAERREWRFGIFGEPWSWSRCRERCLRAVYVGRAIYGCEMAETVRSTAVSLNILRTQNRESHNMRTFEIPGSGGCMVSQYNADQDSYFPDQRAARYARSPEAAIAVIAELLANRDRRNEIAREAGEIARGHTYVERARCLLEAVDRA